MLTGFNQKKQNLTDKEPAGPKNVFGTFPSIYMIPLERRQKIMELVGIRGVISISELVEDLNVSHMTIRRDLQKLEQEGLVVQVSGGVQILKKLAAEPLLAVRQTMATAEKGRIGKAAAARVQEGACVYLDAGTTALSVAQNLASRSDLTIISNDFEVISYLATRTDSELIHVGGQVRKKTYSCVGPIAAQILSQFSIDIAFISTSSWDVRGITTPDMDKVTLKKALAAASVCKVLISDSSKYGQVATFIALPLSEFSVIITDTKLPEAARTLIRHQNIDLQLV